MCKYIGNIVTKSSVEPFSEFVRVTDNINDVDFNLPTLIVGWEDTKSYFPEANILEKHIKDNIYWTFSPEERCYRFETDYKDFQKKVAKYLSSVIQYQYFSIFTSSLTDIKKVISFIKKKKSIILIEYNMAYLLYGTKIIGFSFADAEYIGVKKEKILNLFKGNQLIFNDDFLSDEDKRTFSGSNIAIPYLYSLTL